MILLDTHAWIWYLADLEKLSEPALYTIRRAAENERGQVLVSAISVWELFTLVKKHRLEINGSPAAFLTATHQDPAMEISPIDAAIARRSVELPDHHADPADRLILATAQELGCPIVSRDQRFPDYKAADIIWQHPR